MSSEVNCEQLIWKYVKKSGHKFYLFDLLGFYTYFNIFMYSHILALSHLYLIFYQKPCIDLHQDHLSKVFVSTNSLIFSFNHIRKYRTIISWGHTVVYCPDKQFLVYDLDNTPWITSWFRWPFALYTTFDVLSINMML